MAELQHLISTVHCIDVFKSWTFLQQVFVVLQTLGSSPPNNRSDGPPLSRHQLGQMKQLLLLFSGPFCFLDAGVQPLIPAHKQKVMGMLQSEMHFQ